MIVSVEDVSMKGGGNELKQQIWNAARDTIQEWTGQRLAECSLYGVRIYEEGAVLATHVDRLPLVSLGGEMLFLPFLAYDGLASDSAVSCRCRSAQPLSMWIRYVMKS